jgi:hypothetical protein
MTLFRLRIKPPITVAVCVGLITLGSAEASLADSSIRVIAGSADNCISSRGRPESAASDIAMAVGSAIIRSSLPAIGRYLTSVAQSTSSPIMTAIGYADLFRVERRTTGEIATQSNLECLVIYTGNFGDLSSEGFSVGYAHASDPDGIFVQVSAGQSDVSTLRRLGLVDFPNSYFEFNFVRHRTAEAIRLSPAIAYFRATNATHNTSAAKNIEITVTIAKPSPTGSLDVKKAAEETGLVAQVPIVLKQVIPGRIRRQGILGYDTLWIAAPKAPADNEVSAAKELLEPGQSLAISPANFFVTYRETDEPYLMLSILASIVSDNSEQMSSGLEDALRSVLAKGAK